MKFYNLISFKQLYDNCLKNKKMAVKTAYKFNKLLTKIEQEITFYQSKFNEIVETYAEKDENGQLIFVNEGTNIKIREDSIELAQKELNELNELEAEIPDIKFTLEELDNFEFTMEEINTLLPFIEEDK